MTASVFEQESESATQTERATCSLCAAVVPVQQMSWLEGQPACPSCVEQIRTELADQQPEGKHYPIAAVGGLVGAFLGAAVWAGIAIITDFEVGYVAILVGFLAGLGVKLAAGKKRSQGMQIMAAALSIVGLLIAKYMILAHVLVSLAAEGGVEVSYFDPTIFEIFPAALKEMLSPFDALWLILAVGAAYRVPQPSQIALQQ
jgi:hypothetical protein